MLNQVIDYKQHLNIENLDKKDDIKLFILTVAKIRVQLSQINTELNMLEESIILMVQSQTTESSYNCWDDPPTQIDHEWSLNLPHDTYVSHQWEQPPCNGYGWDDTTTQVDYEWSSTLHSEWNNPHSTHVSQQWEYPPCLKPLDSRDDHPTYVSQVWEYPPCLNHQDGWY